MQSNQALIFWTENYVTEIQMHLTNYFNGTLVNNCWNIKTFFYLLASGGESFNLYLKTVNFLTLD